MTKVAPSFFEHTLHMILLHYRVTGRHLKEWIKLHSTELSVCLL